MVPGWNLTNNLCNPDTQTIELQEALKPIEMGFCTQCPTIVSFAVVTVWSFMESNEFLSVTQSCFFAIAK